MNRVVLVTRPEPGLARTIAAVQALGHPALAAPSLRITELVPSIPRDVVPQAILLTSGQAACPLSRLAPHLHDVRVLTVGDATASRAGDAGFSHILSAGGDAADLLALAGRSLSPTDGPLLLACGAGQGQALATDLRGLGFRVLRRCVYHARPAQRLPQAAQLALRQGRVAAILLFSAESAACFARLLPSGLDVGAIRALAISTRALGPLRDLGFAVCAVAAAPSEAALLDLLQALPAG